MIFKLDKDPYDDDRVLFKKTTLELEEGKTYCLVGCNGSGKSTVMNYIKRHLQKKEKAFEICGKFGDFQFLLNEGKFSDYMFYVFNKNTENVDDEYGHILLHAAVATSSTGEGILQRLGNDLVTLRQRILHPNSKNKHFWILFDDCDAGTSLDVMCEIKEVISLIRQDCDDNHITLTIILSANAYEIARDYECIDVYDFSKKEFKDYEDYKKFVLRSKKRKDKSYENGN